MRRTLQTLLILVGGLLGQLTAAQQTYFPEGVLGRDAQSSRFRVEWYSKQLEALEEPSLLELAKDSSLQSYRFVWLRTFDHPVVVRLRIVADGTGELTTKVASGAGGYEPGKLIEDTSHPLTREQTAVLLGKIDNAGFWQLSSYEGEPKNMVHLDGAQWIVEGIKDSRYHVVDRWSPSKGAVRELGLYLVLELGKVKVPKSQIY